MSFAIAGLHLKSGCEILRRFSRVSQIVQYKAAINISNGHFRIALNREREVFQRSLQVSVVFIDVAGN